jgi:PAS domain S-box-containing protein
MTILIVDDNPDNLYQLQILLTMKDYQVVSAENGAQALAKARQNPPDLIICDVLMPVMDGFALCREWKKDERLRSIPFIFYTATYTDERDREFALGLGAGLFLIKPEEPDSFLWKIQEIIQQVHNSLPFVSDDVLVKGLQEEEGHLKQYNEVLIRKLEVKMTELERANRELGREILERGWAEKSLHESEARYKSIVDNIGMGVALISPNMEILSLNKQMQKWNPHVDLQDKHICYRSFNKPPREGICSYCPTARTLKDGLVHEAITETSMDGKVLNYRIVSSAIKDEKGKVVAAIEMVEDITEHTKMELTAKKHLNDLEVFYASSINREERILELKKEIEVFKKNEKK